jgi:ribulose-5-phosphate 4-epimerase/fuculose-1-phosphate aldolase
LVADLGDKKAMILHNHGLLTCAPTIGDAFTTLYLLETACKVQVDAMRSGTELVMPDGDAIARTAAHGEELTGEREWQAVLRSLERTDPSYRD